ncbi:unnamed protein product [Anisakis simplex]|uniref:Acyl-coenzyme A thioesterase 8 (inferred by orthology to a human protein) n=1 Tax=Anisakis simplex TaxID=6269 RepID=A0A0M3KKK9_ANISI|nr:unnamed protein product [Anisakis simplex]
MFILAAGISKPIDYFVKTLRDGRSFCTRWVEAKQRGHIVFTCQISFHSWLRDGAEQLLEQAAQGHYQINPVREERLRQRIKDKFKVGAPLFEMRPTDLEEFLALKMSPEPNKSFVWVKSVPKLREDDRIHRMMALYNTDSTLTRVALKSHLT